MCYRRHQFSEDPLVHIGEQDITSHVDFSALRRWGEELGLKTIGYTSQGAFLMSTGLDEEIQRLVSSSRDYLFEAAKIKGLILPQGMGESHMVMIQYKGEGAPLLKGFTMRNRMRYL
jgi:SAM-dependent MidA family methyltransferase